MATFEFQLPNGKTAEINVPEGMSAQDAFNSLPKDLTSAPSGEKKTDSYAYQTLLHPSTWAQKAQTELGQPRTWAEAIEHPAGQVARTVYETGKGIAETVRHRGEAIENIAQFMKDTYNHPVDATTKILGDLVKNPDMLSSLVTGTGLVGRVGKMESLAQARRLGTEAEFKAGLEKPSTMPSYEQATREIVEQKRKEMADKPYLTHEDWNKPWKDQEQVPVEMLSTTLDAKIKQFAKAPGKEDVRENLDKLKVLVGDKDVLGVTDGIHHDAWYINNKLNDLIKDSKGVEKKAYQDIRKSFSDDIRKGLKDFEGDSSMPTNIDRIVRNDQRKSVIDDIYNGLIEQRKITGAPESIKVDSAPVASKIRSATGEGLLTAEEAKDINNFVGKVKQVEGLSENSIRQLKDFQTRLETMTGKLGTVPGIAGGIGLSMLGHPVIGVLGGIGAELASGKISSYLANIRLAKAVQDLPGGKQILNQILAESKGKLTSKAGTMILNFIARSATGAGTAALAENAKD